VTKKDLIVSIAKKTDLSKKTAAAAVEAMFEALEESQNRNGNPINLVGFGTFSVARRASSSRAKKSVVHGDRSPITRFKASKGIQEEAILHRIREGFTPNVDIVIQSEKQRDQADLLVKFSSGRKWLVEIVKNKELPEKHLESLIKAAEDETATPVIAYVTDEGIEYRSARTGRRLQLTGQYSNG